jgi:hypothetical protein
MRKRLKWLAAQIGAALVALSVEKLLGLIGGAALLALALRVLAKVRGLPQDWYVTLVAFLGALVLIMISMILTRRKTRAALPVNTLEVRGESPEIAASGYQILYS